MMVALETPAPLGSCTEPVTLPERFCAVSRRVASGSERHNAKNGMSSFVPRDKRFRLTDGFSMAANLLSRFVGRAMARALDQARPEFSRVLARSSSWLAYWAG